VDGFELVVDFAHRWEAKVTVKGLRVILTRVEFQMNQLNRPSPGDRDRHVMASPQAGAVLPSG
jgi:phosphopantetheine adenylyltransferase